MKEKDKVEKQGSRDKGQGQVMESEKEGLADRFSQESVTYLKQKNFLRPNNPIKSHKKNLQISSFNHISWNFRPK